MKSVLAVAAAVALASASGAPLLARDSVPLPTQYACKLFKDVFPSNTFFANSTEYNAQNTDYYSAAAWLGPACVVEPQTAEEMGYVIKALGALEAEFAVRGGGHMPATGAANIDSNGVLVSTSGLKSLTLSDDQATVSIGAGSKWVDVLNFLEPYGLATVGGRVGLVGVSGYTLGGGISFYGNQYGFASANVVAYQAVLASGKVVIASSNSYSDLFWALQGGGNSFAIVTQFTMRVHSSPSVYVGTTAYSSQARSSWLNAVYKFALSRDTKAAGIPLIAASSSADKAIYAMTRFYDSSNPSAANASVWKDFTAPNISQYQIADSYSPRHIARYLEEETDPQISAQHGLRQRFHALSSKVSKKALRIVHDNYISLVAEKYSQIPDLFTTAAIQPISCNFIEKSSGTPQGLPSADGPLFWYVLSFSWSSSASDTIINELVEALDSKINAAFEKAGVREKYLYLNDADSSQDVLETYPEENVKKLISIRNKYDPDKVLTDLLVGGWKIADLA